MSLAQTIKAVAIAATLAAGCLQVTSVMATATTQGWRFEVLLDDKQIGYHDFNVTDDSGRQVLQTEASFDVKFLFITAFRYRHQNTEIWSNGCLTSIEAATNSNGDKLTVSGQQIGDVFTVERAAGDAALDRCVRTFAYWNPEILDAERLLNSQTGEYERVVVIPEGEDQVYVDGSSVDAYRYRLVAEAGDILLWYTRDVARRWLALEAPAKGGRTLRYKPLSIPGDVLGGLAANR